MNTIVGIVVVITVLYCLGTLMNQLLRLRQLLISKEIAPEDTFKKHYFRSFIPELPLENSNVPQYISFSFVYNQYIIGLNLTHFMLVQVNYYFCTETVQ